MKNKSNQNEERVHGKNATWAIWKNRPEDIISVFITKKALTQNAPLIKYCVEKKKAYHIVNLDELKAMTNSEHHEEICLLVKTKPFTYLDQFKLDPTLKHPTILVLAGVSNPHNVGAIIRSAAHFNITAIFLPKEIAKLSSATIRTAEGGSESCEIVSFNDIQDIVNFCEKNHVKIYTTSSHEAPNASPLYSTKLEGAKAFFLGEEKNGLSSQILKIGNRIFIDGSNKVESLNVSVAAAIIMGECYRQATRKK